MNSPLSIAPMAQNRWGVSGFYRPFAPKGALITGGTIAKN
jgi:hypothetical protein